MTQPENEQYDVAIIGYGPVGATLAHLLGQCGVKVLVLERESEAYHLPRAVHFDDEIMRVFQSFGLAEEVSKIVRINPGMRFVDADDNILLDWPRPAQVGPNGWHPSFRVHQPDLENILRNNMQKHSNVTVKSRCEAFFLDDTGSDVKLRYEDMSKGKIHHATAKFVVGCDGARSFVRRFIDTSMIDLGFHERWLVVDVLLNAPKPSLGDFSIQYCDPARPATYVRCPDNRRRWEITVLPDEDTAQISTPNSVWKLLSNWLSPDEAELERAAVYTFHSLIAKDWRKGRLFLAGDSAHQTPPFMGQGMCAGIRDSANLAWKLALVVHDKADDTILDSYQSERLPNAEEFIQTAVRLGGLINTCGTQEALRKVFPQDDGSAKMKSILPPIGPGLGKGEFAGKLFPQPKMNNGKWMDDVVGYRCTIVAKTAFLEGAVVSDDVAVVTADMAQDARQYLDELGVDAVLLRPDRYILATAKNENDRENFLALALPAPALQPTNEMV